MSTFLVRDKVVVVTGGTRGLGRVLSLHLAGEGARVFAGWAQDESAARGLEAEAGARGLAITAVRANLMTPSGPETLAREVLAAGGRVDALVHNAATGVHKPLAELGARHLSAVFGVNVAAFLELANRLRPAMPPGARIVALSSEGARHAVPAYGAVGSSKAALEAVCRQLAVEWAPGVAVNVVAPGLLDTHSLAAMEDGPDRRAREVAGSPQGRLVTTDEVARVVHFLLSPASEGIVGQTIVVDGGRSVRAGL